MSIPEGASLAQGSHSVELTNGGVTDSGATERSRLLEGKTTQVATRCRIDLGRAARPLTQRAISIIDTLCNPLRSIVFHILARIIHPASHNQKIASQLEGALDQHVGRGLQGRQLTLSSTCTPGVEINAFETIEGGYFTQPQREGAPQTAYLHIYGNQEGYETHLDDDREVGKHLYINGPGVGKSTGVPSPTTWAHAVLLGIRRLEEAGHTKIVLKGFSLGAGAIGEALRRHPFKAGVSYEFQADRTFSKLSLAAGHLSASYVAKTGGRVYRFVQSLVTSLLTFLGLELDPAAGAKRMLKAGHQVTVIQSSLPQSDGVIARVASLAEGLQEPHERLLLQEHPVGHNDDIEPPPEEGGITRVAPQEDSEALWLDRQSLADFHAAFAAAFQRATDG